MSRQHPWPHETGNGILILILVSEILDHCQKLLDDPRILIGKPYWCIKLKKSSQTISANCLNMSLSFKEP